MISPQLYWVMSDSEFTLDITTPKNRKYSVWATIPTVRISTGPLSVCITPVSYTHLGLYILAVGAGYVFLLMGGLWLSRLLKHNLMDDVFNNCLLYTSIAAF